MNQPAMSIIITMARLFQPRIDILHRLSYIMLYLYDISEYTVLYVYIYTHEIDAEKIGYDGSPEYFLGHHRTRTSPMGQAGNTFAESAVVFCAVVMGLGVRHKRSISEIVIPNM